MIKDDSSSVGQVQFAKCLSALYRLFTESNSSLNGSENDDISSKHTSYHASSEEKSNVNTNERWVKCWRVWRKLIDNDVILLALLFHSGSVWSPNYAQLHAKKLFREEVLEHEEEKQMQKSDTGSSTKMCNNNTSTSSFHKKVKEEKEFVENIPSEGVAVAVGSTTSENNAVGRIIKREEEEEEKEELKSSQTKQSQMSKLNAHLRKYLECMQEIPESIWALNVLHFLRLVEVYELCSNKNNMYKSEAVLVDKTKDAEIYVYHSATSYKNIGEENKEDNVSGLSSTLASSSSSLSSSVCSFEEIEKSANSINIKKKRTYIKKVNREEHQYEQEEEEEVAEETKLRNKGKKEDSNNKRARKRKRLLLSQPSYQSNQHKHDNTLKSKCNTEWNERKEAAQKEESENFTHDENGKEKHKMCITNNTNNHYHVEWDTSMSYTLRLDDLLSCSSFNPMKLTYQQYLEQQTIQLKEALSALGDVSSQINVLKGIVTCTFRDEVMVQTVASTLVDEWFELFSKKGQEESKVNLSNCNTTIMDVKQTSMVRDYFLSSAIKFAALAQTISSQSSVLYKENECAQEFDNSHLLHLHHIMLRQEFTLDKPQVHDVFCRAIPSIFTVYLLEEFEQSQQQQQQLFSSLQLLSLPFHYCFAPHTSLNISSCKMENNTSQKWNRRKCITSSSMLLESESTHSCQFTLALQCTNQETSSGGNNKMETKDNKNTAAKMRKGKTPMIAPFSNATSRQRGRPNASKQVHNAKSIMNNGKEGEESNQDNNNKKIDNCTLNVSDVFIAEFNTINERSLFMREITRYNEKNDELESQSSHSDYSTSVNFVSDHDFTHYANSNSSKGRNWRRSRRDKYKRRRFGGLFDTDETDFTFVNLTSVFDLCNDDSEVKVLCKESQMHDKIALVEEIAHVEVISVQEAILALLINTTSSTTEKTKQPTEEKKLLLFYSPSSSSSQLGSSSPHETQLLTSNANLVCNGTCTFKVDNKKQHDNNYYSGDYNDKNTFHNLHALSAVNDTVTFLFTTARRVIAMHASEPSNFSNEHEHNLEHSESSSNNNYNNVSMLVLAVQCALHALILLTCLDPIAYRCDSTSVYHNNSKVQMEWLQRKVEITSFIVEVCVSTALSSNTLLQIGFMSLLVLWHSSCARTVIVDDKLITTTTATTETIGESEENIESGNEYTLQWQLTLIAIKLFATLAQREVECVNFKSNTSNSNNNKNKIDKIRNEVNADNFDSITKKSNNNKCGVEERSVHRLPAPWWSSFRSAVIKRENLQCYIPAAWSTYMLRVEEIVQVAMQQLMLVRRHVVHPTEHITFQHIDKREGTLHSNNDNYGGKKPSQVKNKYKHEDMLEYKQEEEQQKIQNERELAQNEKGNNNNNDEFSDEEIVDEEKTSQIILSDAQPCYYGSSVVCSSVPLVHIVEETSIPTLDEEEEELQKVQQKNNKLYNNIDGDDDDDDDVELLPYLPPHLRQGNRTTNNNKNSNPTIKLQNNRESSKKLNKAASMLWLSLEGVVNCDSLHTSSVVSTPRWSESDE